MSLKLRWPESLSDITCKNVTATELWFLKEQMESGALKLRRKDITVRTPKFGYEECYVDIGDQRYLVKYKTWAGEWEGARLNTMKHVIFYVQKFKHSRELKK